MMMKTQQKTMRTETISLTRGCFLAVLLLVLVLDIPTTITGFQPVVVVDGGPGRAVVVASGATFSPSDQGRVLTMSSTTEQESETSAAPGYVPKWKKKKTLADDSGDLDFSDKGIKGTVSVVFKQGNATKTTMAMPGQPLRDVATQAGQFIKYGCGKGECGTCEAMCNGKWVRPCKDVVPFGAAEDGHEAIVIQVKDVASKTTSSGQFFSVKSFFMGFYNNLLGMAGFVKYRKNARENWEERQEYEALIRSLTLEKRAARLARQGQPPEKVIAATMENDSSSTKNGGLSP